MLFADFGLYPGQKFWLKNAFLGRFDFSRLTFCSSFCNFLHDSIRKTQENGKLQSCFLNRNPLSQTNDIINSLLTDGLPIYMQKSSGWSGNGFELKASQSEGVTIKDRSHSSRTILLCHSKLEWLWVRRSSTSKTSIWNAAVSRDGQNCVLEINASKFRKPF